MNMYRTCLTVAGTLLLSMPAVTNIAVGDEPVTAKQESLEGIIAACQEAKSQFRPLTKEDLKSVKAELVEALARLDTKLKSSGDNGQDWRKYLLWETLQKELQKEDSESGGLNEIYEPLCLGQRGIGIGMVRRRSIGLVALAQGGRSHRQSQNQSHIRTHAG